MVQARGSSELTPRFLCTIRQCKDLIHKVTELDTERSSAAEDGTQSDEEVVMRKINKT